MVPAAAAAIYAGASLLGAGGQAYAQGKQNKKTRQWNEAMYHTQRKDALSDWNLQNEYNSPAAQMQRFKDAGLNPNLIYGQSNEAGGIRSAEKGSWNPQAPDVKDIVPNAVNAYQNQKMFELNSNQTAKQIELMEKEGNIKDATALAIALGIQDKTYDLQYKQQINPVKMDTARAKLDQIDWQTHELIQKINIGKEKWEIDKVKAQQSITNMIEQVRASEQGRKLSEMNMQKIEQEIKNLATQGDLLQYQKNIEAILSQAGFKSSDNFVIKLLTMAADKFGKKK